MSFKTTSTLTLIDLSDGKRTTTTECFFSNTKQDALRDAKILLRMANRKANNRFFSFEIAMNYKLLEVYETSGYAEIGCVEEGEQFHWTLKCEKIADDARNIEKQEQPNIEKQEKQNTCTIC